jgi:hypothetical protein
LSAVVCGAGAAGLVDATGFFSRAAAVGLAVAFAAVLPLALDFAVFVDEDCFADFDLVDDDAVDRLAMMTQVYAFTGRLAEPSEARRQRKTPPG